VKKPSVLIIFLTVFIDLIGFGIVVPLVPLYSRDFQAGGFLIGAIIAAFSAMQFVFAPIWGHLSDRIGRRPVLLLSTAGAAVSYALFAVGSGLTQPAAALTTMLISRAFAGACGGNIGVAQAYIADITPPEQRSRRMGLIGMAFGLGFVFGPIIGGLSLKFLGSTGPGWVAAGFCLANFLLAFMILVESHRPNSEHVPARPRLAQWRHTLSQPKIGLLVMVFFLATFCFSCFEVTLPLLVTDNFHINVQHDRRTASTITYLFAYCGVIGALVQGGLIGRLVRRLGEPRVIGLSLLLTGLSLVPLPLIHGIVPGSWAGMFQASGLGWLVLLGVLAALSIGSSLTRPPLFGLLSVLTPAAEQGVNLGVAQAAGSLARILGPIFAAPLFMTHPLLPYFTCAVIAILTGLITLRRLHTTGSRSASPATRA
jgi:MFS family permease